MSKKSIKNNNGFTLIELLIVLTILVSLTLMGTYKYFNIVEENKQKIDISNAKILAEAVNVAEATGQLIIDADTTTIEYDDLKSVLNNEIVPTSKKYTAKSETPGFIITVLKTGNDFTTKVTAAGEQLYPMMADSSDKEA